MNRIERRYRRGFSLVYATIGLVALCAFVSLGVDLGRVQLVKTELQRAADAAARYAAKGVEDSSSLSRAREAAQENLVDGAPLILSDDDVVSGNWDPSQNPSFDPARFPANAIRITAERSALRGNAVPLLFAQVIGMTSLDVRATSIVMIDRGSDSAGFIGINSLSMNGSTTVDSYDSNFGSYPAGAGKVSVASNGDIYMYDTASISGGAHPGPGHRVYRDSGTTVESTAPLSDPMSFSNVSAGSFATSNDNTNIPPGNRSGGNFRMTGNQDLTLPGGNYYVKDFEMGGNSSLHLSGPATFWITGDVKAAGTIFTGAAKPANLKLRVIGSGDVTFSGNSALAAEVYAPLSDVKINGNPSFSGAIVGNVLNIVGNPQLHYDRALDVGTPITWNTYTIVK